MCVCLGLKTIGNGVQWYVVVRQTVCVCRHTGSEVLGLCFCRIEIPSSRVSLCIFDGLTPFRHFFDILGMYCRLFDKARLGVSSPRQKPRGALVRAQKYTTHRGGDATEQVAREGGKWAKVKLLENGPVCVDEFSAMFRTE